MPELPEVELSRRALSRWLAKDPIRSTEARPSRIFRGSRLSRFLAIRGRVSEIRRRGKYLLWHLPRGEGLLAHLGMTGKFIVRKQGESAAYSLARFILQSGRVIHYCDPRRFGRLAVAPLAELEGHAPWTELGVDPLADGLTGPQLKAAIGRTRRELKVALMDQSRVAGLGNLHVAEALFRAKLDPRRQPGGLSAKEWARLARGIHAALAFGLEGTFEDEIVYMSDAGYSDNPFFVYDRAGEPCRRCRTPIECFAQGGRTTYYCRRCQ